MNRVATLVCNLVPLEWWPATAVSIHRYSSKWASEAKGGVQIDADGKIDGVLLAWSALFVKEWGVNTPDFNFIPLFSHWTSIYFVSALCRRAVLRVRPLTVVLVGFCSNLKLN